MSKTAATVCMLTAPQIVKVRDKRLGLLHYIFSAHPPCLLSRPPTRPCVARPPARACVLPRVLPTCNPDVEPAAASRTFLATDCGLVTSI